MKEKELNKELRTSAIRNGLCAQWQSDWAKDWDLEMMVTKFYKGLDFYLKTKFISNAAFKTCFDKTFLRENGVLVDDTFSLLNPYQSILIGKSQSTIRCNNDDISVLYVIDKSRAKIIARGKSYVLVHAMDLANISVEVHDEAEVTVIIHSNSVTLETNDDVNIRYELDYLKKK